MPSAVQAWLQVLIKSDGNLGKGAWRRLEKIFTAGGEKFET